mmetsp:Transcript_142582/g.397265  ORF Transcript_142582/g.397265 Transcript_142582/m.397265 type:complete len:205 (+) Transcript_142582:2-616(+)
MPRNNAEHAYCVRRTELRPSRCSRARGASEALGVHNTRSHFVVLALPYEHLLEARELGNDRSTHPHNVPALRARHDLHVDLLRCQRLQLLREPHIYARKHCVASAENYVLEEISPQIDVAGLDAPVRCMVNAGQLAASQHGVKHHLGYSEALCDQVHLVPIRELINLLEVRGSFLSSLQCVIVIIFDDITGRLLHVSDDLLLRG